MRIHELTLFGADIEGLRRYYAGVLGLREVEPGETGRLAVQAGRTRLVFQPAATGAAPLGVQPRYHFAFDVPPGRFDAALEWLQQRGGPIASPEGETRFRGTWNNDSVYFADPQGNILELIARYDLMDGTNMPPESPRRANHDRPFNASEIVAVTEIGLATDSVADTVGALKTRLPGLDVYSGESSDTFTAVGDVHGLLIVVRRGRIWFPETGVPAQYLPLDARIEVEAGRRYRVTAPPFPFDTSPSG